MAPLAVAAHLVKLLVDMADLAVHVIGPHIGIAHSLDALVQQELDSDDDLDALVAAELDAETEAEPEPELEPTDGEWPRTAEEMDEHLEICFLQAARTRLHKKKVLPLDAAVVYAGHMRKVRRTGTDLVRPLSW